MNVTSSNSRPLSEFNQPTQEKPKDCPLSAELGLFPSIEDVKKHPNLVAQDAVELIKHGKGQGFSSPENQGHLRITGGYINLELIPLTDDAHRQLSTMNKESVQTLLLKKYDIKQADMTAEILSISKDIIQRTPSI